MKLPRAKYVAWRRMCHRDGIDWKDALRDLIRMSVGMEAEVVPPAWKKGFAACIARQNWKEVAA